MAWLSQLAHTNLIWAITAYIFVRAIAIVVPPIPGAVFDLASVQIFGWWQGFLISEVGIMFGASIAFRIGRRLKTSTVGDILCRLLKVDKIRVWEQQLPPRDQFLAWIALRLPTNPAFDYISYAAGLTGCSFSIFFWSTLLGNIPVVFVLFALAGVGFRYNSLVGWILPVSFLVLFSIPVTLRLRRKIHQTRADQDVST